MDTRYKVSVRLMTYNQEKYISQAIESVLAQKTNFPVELIIGDDNSTDATFTIASKFMDRDNIYIRLLDRRNDEKYKRHRAKFGRNFNNTDILKNCTGQYIAMLEGDDYWTDPLKLQKQVDFMESNPDYAFCYHHIKVIQEQDFANQKLEMKFDQPETSTLREILKKTIWAHTNSVVFRNSPQIRNMPPWYYDCFSADWALLAIIAGNDKIKYIPDTMSVYRQHGGGIWSRNTKLSNTYNTIKTAKKLKANLVKKNNVPDILWPLLYSYQELFLFYRKTNLFKAFYYFIQVKFHNLNYRYLLKLQSLQHS